MPFMRSVESKRAFGDDHEHIPDVATTNEWQAAITSGLVISALSWVIFLSGPNDPPQMSL